MTGQSTKDFATKTVPGMMRIRLVSDRFLTDTGSGGGISYNGQHLGVSDDKGKRLEHDVDEQFGRILVQTGRAERYDEDAKRWIGLSAYDMAHQVQ
jgi:hypothetical protein